MSSPLDSSHHQSSPSAAGDTSANQPAPKPQLTKAQSDRARQNVKAMAYSALATVVVVLFIFMLNPQRDRDLDPQIDVATTATEVANVSKFTPAVPEVPEDWMATFARWNSGLSDHVPSWDVGYVDANEDFARFTQTSDANPTWISQQVRGAASQETRQISGHTFSVHRADNGHTYWVAEVPEQAVGTDAAATEILIVSGTMSDDALETLAAHVLSSATS